MVEPSKPLDHRHCRYRHIAPQQQRAVLSASGRGEWENERGREKEREGEIDMKGVNMDGKQTKFADMNNESKRAAKG